MLFRRDKRRINRLLVVEDEPLVAFDNEYFLEQEGYEIVATVDNASDALAAIEREAIDAILLDVNLAGPATGLDVARAARTRQIAVLFLSGHLPDEAAELGMAALMKPYMQRDLAGALHAMDALTDGREPEMVPPALRLFGNRSVRPAD